MIGGKWKLRILYVVGFHHVIRYNELKRQLAPITHNMLSRQLKDLERDGLIIRTEHPQVPPKVEYRLHKKGFVKTKRIVNIRFERRSLYGFFKYKGYGYCK